MTELHRQLRHLISFYAVPGTDVDKAVEDIEEAVGKEFYTRFKKKLPAKRDQYYGMGDCHDFSCCVPGYIDDQSVEWWNEAIDECTKAAKRAAGLTPVKEANND